VEVDPGAIPMAEAEFIFSVAAMGSKTGTFPQTAAALGATEGASRVAVDDGFMARERQVGASGTWVTARVYVAVGIRARSSTCKASVACDKVVAINLDPACDMIKRADLSVIGDSGVSA
jgi:electron transfer flavoprotein alpha subunit